MADSNLQALARAELARRKAKPQTSKGEAFTRSFTGSTVDNLMGIPNLLDIPGKVVNDVKGVVGAFNPNNYQNMPDPTGPQTFESPERIGKNQVFGAAQRMGEGAAALASGDFTQFQQGRADQNQAQISQQMEQDQPGASLLGEIGGDVAFLTSLRNPMAAGRQRMQQTIRTVMAEAAKKPGLPGMLNTAALKIAESHLPRGIARAAETGLEGAILSIMDGNDPWQTAGLAAGSQVLGSLAITAGKHTFSNLGAAVLVGAVGLNYLNMLPGGDSGAIDAIQGSMTKVLPTIAIGTLAAAAGYSRMPAWMQEKVPEIADAISTLPRGAVTSLIQEAFDEREKGENSVAMVVGKYSQNPDYFGATAARRLERALMSEDVKVSEVIDSLMDNKEFRDKFNELGE